MTFSVFSGYEHVVRDLNDVHLQNFFVFYLLPIDKPASMKLSHISIIIDFIILSLIILYFFITKTNEQPF